MPDAKTIATTAAICFAVLIINDILTRKQPTLSAGALAQMVAP